MRVQRPSQEVGTAPAVRTFVGGPVLKDDGVNLAHLPAQRAVGAVGPKGSAGRRRHPPSCGVRISWDAKGDSVNVRQPKMSPEDPWAAIPSPAGAAFRWPGAQFGSSPAIDEPETLRGERAREDSSHVSSFCFPPRDEGVEGGSSSCVSVVKKLLCCPNGPTSRFVASAMSLKTRAGKGRNFAASRKSSPVCVRTVRV